jgi:hypothetical protein
VSYAGIFLSLPDSFSCELLCLFTLVVIFSSQLFLVFSIMADIILAPGGRLSFASKVANSISSSSENATSSDTIGDSTRRLLSNLGSRSKQCHTAVSRSGSSTTSTIPSTSSSSWATTGNPGSVS